MVQVPARSVLMAFHPDHQPAWVLPGAVTEGLVVELVLERLP